MPDPSLHNPSPTYLRELIEQIGLSQREIARRLGISDSQLRRHLIAEDRPNYRPAPYLLQFALECWAARANELAGWKITNPHNIRQSRQRLVREIREAAERLEVEPGTPARRAAATRVARLIVDRARALARLPWPEESRDAS